MNELNNQLAVGAFLTSEFEGKVNSMTIGWGMEGRCWGKPVFIAMIRPSRFTFHLIEGSQSFTVSIPKTGEMKDEIKYLGTASGRDEDKIKKSGVLLKDANTIKGKIIDGCEQYYECKVLFSQVLDKNQFTDDGHILNTFYKDDDLHYIIFAEISASY